MPYLLAVAMASNIGSAATVTGNPQNMIIGSLSHIPYGAFAAALSPVAAAGLVLAAALLVAGFPGEFLTRDKLGEVRVRLHVNRALLATAALIASFFWSMAPANAAIVAAPMDAAGQAGASLCRDRLGASLDVRRAFHRRRGRGAARADGRPACPDRKARSH